MAYQTIATRWLLSRRPSIAVSFVEYKWEQPQWIDIQAQIEVDGEKHSGRGTDKIGDLALEKASSEAIERWCCQKLSISTAGCAVHSSEAEATTKSQLEFQERFIFNSFLKSGGAAKELSPFLFEQDKVRLWQIEATTVIAISYSDSTPTSLGVAKEQSIDQAIEKSKIESLRNLFSFKNDPTQFKSIIQRDNNFWCCDPGLLNNALKKLEAPTSHVVDVKSGSTNTQTVKSILGFDDCPLFFSRTVEG